MYSITLDYVMFSSVVRCFNRITFYCKAQLLYLYFYLLFKVGRYECE